MAERTVDFEHASHRLLAVTDPLALEFGHVYAEDIASATACKLKHAGRLAGTGSAIEDGVEALTHTGGEKALLHFLEVLNVQKVLQTGYLSTLRLIEE